MVKPEEELSTRRQCELLGINRSGLYYEPVPTSQEELTLMRRIDELHLERPFYGSRKVMQVLKGRGEDLNRKHVQRLMRLMGLEAMVPKPRTSDPAPEHATFPYLLRRLKISRPNQVWASDVTYIPLAHGFAYLVAVMDWYSRLVLAWRLSTTLDPSFCVEAVQEALWRYGQPGIFNTDQGSQFTADAFTRPLLDLGVKVSMDGKGRYLDNIFVERLWRSLKYEEVYLHAYDSPAEARSKIGAYMDFYSTQRPHQTLGYQTPLAFYQTAMTTAAA